MVLIVVIAALIGIVMGVAATYLWTHRSYAGTIIFYQMSPEEAPVMTAELNESVDILHNRTTALFKVSHN